MSLVSNQSAEDACAAGGCIEILGGNETRTQTLQLAGLELLLIARPAGGGTGGDLYCLHSCGDHTVAKIVLLDVTGHGARSASVARALHGLLHEYSPETRPSHVLSQLNRNFPQGAPPGVLATSVCAVYDSRQSHLHYANGGQPRLLLWSAQRRQWRTVGPGWDSACGVPFGVTEGACYDEQRIPFHPGDMALFVSDGVPEAASPTGGWLQLEGVLGLLQEMTDEIPPGFPLLLPDLAKSFLKKLQSFHGRDDFEDDLTLLWVRRPAAGVDPNPSGHDL